MPVDPNTPHPRPSADGFVTLTCPHCAMTLRTASHASVEGPCPNCGTTIRYLAPEAPAPPATFVPRQRRSSKPDEPEFEKPRAEEAPRPRTPLTKRTRTWKRQAKEFFRSNTGRLVACTALAALVFFAVFLFFKWDQKRRFRAANPTPPPVEEVVDDAEAEGGDKAAP